jgi:CheY-like chemotaxis protein
MLSEGYLPGRKDRPMLSPENPAESSAKRVLIAEDDAAIREALGLVLRREGYAVVEAANGREALDRLHEQPCPCLVLLDLMMPQVDGWTFLETKHRDSAIAAVPVLVLTALGDPAPEAVLTLGAVGYLRKPISMEELLTEVRRWCG